MWYIKETKSMDEVLSSKQLGLPNCFKKVIYNYKRRKGKGIIKQIEYGYLYIIPIDLKKEKISPKQVKKICNVLAKTLQKHNVKKLAISEFLDNIEQFKNDIYSQNINILDGRELYQILILDCLKYIAKKQETTIENLDVITLVNDTTDYSIENIKLLAKQVKMVGVVSNNLDKFKNVQEQILKEVGALVKLSNNRKKSLARANIIINIDFPEELLNKYNINNNSIILNISGKANVHKKSFAGMLVQYYEPTIPLKYLGHLKDLEMLDSFQKTILCESLIVKKDTFINLRKKVERENIEISRLIGNNGILQDEDFKKSIDKTQCVD